LTFQALPSLELFLVALNATKECRHYASYLMDLLIINGEWTLSKTPVEMAAGVAVTASGLLHQGDGECKWTDAFEGQLAEHNLSQAALADTCSSLLDTMRELETTRNGQFVLSKYSNAVDWTLPNIAAAQTGQ
jgi:hypothetical protein